MCVCVSEGERARARECVCRCVKGGQEVWVSRLFPVYPADGHMRGWKGGRGGGGGFWRRLQIRGDDVISV